MVISKITTRVILSGSFENYGENYVTGVILKIMVKLFCWGSFDYYGENNPIEEI